MQNTASSLRERAGLRPTRNPIRTSTTGFFRNLPQLRTLRELLPRPEVIYVFGCGIGAEAFSMAMVRADVPDLRIFAFDIEKNEIEAANAGVFNEREVRYYGRDLPSEFSRWLKEGEDRFEVRPEIRSHCTFQVADLFDPFILTLPPADVVTCQNVLIHLPQGLQRRAVRIMRRLTQSGGYLLLGGMHLDVRETIAEQTDLEPITRNSAAIRDGWHDQRVVWDESSSEDRPYYALEPYAYRTGNRDRYVSIFRRDTFDGAAPDEVKTSTRIDNVHGLTDSSSILE